MNLSLQSIQSIDNMTFCAKLKPPKMKSLHALATDTVEFSTKVEELLPRKLEFTETEEIFNENQKKLYTLEQNIRESKKLLRMYYSAQDKYDYQELLKERRKVLNKLDRIAQNAGFSYSDLSNTVSHKRDYNRYAPKIKRATSVNELNEVEILMSERLLLPETKNLLYRLIEQQKKLI